MSGSSRFFNPNGAHDHESPSVRKGREWRSSALFLLTHHTASKHDRHRPAIRRRSLKLFCCGMRCVDGNLDEPAVSRVGFLQVCFNRVSCRSVNSEYTFVFSLFLGICRSSTGYMTSPHDLLTFHRLDFGVPSTQVK